MFRNKIAGQARKMVEANDGTQGSAGGGVDLNSPEIQAAIQARIDAEVAGLKNKNTELLDKYKKSQETASKFEGVDLEEIQKLKKMLETNEEMKLLSEGKADEVVTRRVEAMKRDLEQQLSARDEKLKEYEDIVRQKEGKLATLLIDGSVREAYIELGYEPSALDDVLRYAREVFIMNEDGQPVPRDERGNLIFGKDGKSPITQKEWLEGLASKKPYLKPKSSGAGSSPSRFGSQSFDRSTATSSQLIANGLKKRGLA